MTAGRGIVHAESSLAETEAEKTTHGIQLWTSLPRALKLMEPRYQRLDADSIPASASDGVRVRTIGGTFGNDTGPAQVLMPLVLAHVSLDPGARFEAPVDAGFELAAYVLGGEGRFGPEAVTARTGELVLFAAGERVAIANGSSGTLDAMVLGGAPAEGPLVFHGPFVMNNIEQVRAAEVAYRTGRMGTI